jgi:hypothetical protein
MNAQGSSNCRYSKQKISPRQIKIIHTLAGVLQMDKDTYRDALRITFGVDSSKELTWRQAEELIEDLQRKNGSPSPVKAPRPKPFADLDGRPGMASGAQCRLMAVSWGEVSRAETAEAKMKALDRFIKRIAGVESIRFVKGFQVEKVMKAIGEMKKSKEVADVETTV